LIYEGSPAKQLPGLASVIIRELKGNRRCLYLNSPSMVAGIRSYLAAAGLDVADAVREGSLVLSSSQRHLTNGAFDPAGMLDLLSDAVQRALSNGYEGLWASGDMTWEFGKERAFEKLLAYEYGLEGLFRKFPVLSGICQYRQDTLPIEWLHGGLCSHPGVYINETLSRINPYYCEQMQPQPPLSAPQIQEMIERVRQGAD
jgi:hypothetical protein